MKIRVEKRYFLTLTQSILHIKINKTIISQHYLHWSTKVEVKGFKMMKEWLTKVNIGYINSKHRFYRKVYQG